MLCATVIGGDLRDLFSPGPRATYQLWIRLTQCHFQYSRPKGTSRAHQSSFFPVCSLSRRTIFELFSRAKQTDKAYVIPTAA